MPHKQKRHYIQPKIKWIKKKLKTKIYDLRGSCNLTFSRNALDDIRIT